MTPTLIFDPKQRLYSATATPLPAPTGVRAARWRHYDSIPDSVTIPFAMRLCAIQNLTLQYVDTVTGFCVEKRIGGTKPLVRAVREQRLGIDRLYAGSFKGEAGRLAKESEARNAAEFEDNADALLTRLFYGLDTEVGRLALKGDDKALVIAVHQALTIADVTRMYAREGDEMLRRYHVPVARTGCSMLPNEFLAIADLLPQFAGDCYKLSPSRKITAKAMLNELRKHVIVMPDGTTLQ